MNTANDQPYPNILSSLDSRPENVGCRYDYLCENVLPASSFVRLLLEMATIGLMDTLQENISVCINRVNVDVPV